MIFKISKKWVLTYPAAYAGVLLMKGVTNPASHAELDEQKKALEANLREQFAGKDRAAIEALPVIRAYNQYYRTFDKSYHVQLQLESIAFKGKSIPSVAGLVEAMFMAEVKNMLLTAGHDAAKLKLPVTLNAADGSEQYTLMRGTPQTLKAGDMFMADQQGVISSILYGPDNRASISAETERVLFTVYAPSGIEMRQVQSHLEDIQKNVQVISPSATIELIRVYGAGDVLE